MGAFLAAWRRSGFSRLTLLFYQYARQDFVRVSSDCVASNAAKHDPPQRPSLPERMKEIPNPTQASITRAKAKTEL